MHYFLDAFPVLLFYFHIFYLCNVGNSIDTISSKRGNSWLFGLPDLSKGSTTPCPSLSSLVFYIYFTALLVDP